MSVVDIRRIKENKKIRNIKKNYEETKDDKSKLNVLFLEVDGIWINVRGQKHKRELKLGIIYEGWKKRNTNENCKEYETINKQVYASFNTKRFFKLNDAIISKKYDIDYLKYNIMNGDGAGWIKGGLLSGVIYQLDRFHVNQGIVRAYANEKNKMKKFLKLIKEKEIEEVIKRVKNDKEKNDSSKYVKELYTYLKNNKEYILRYNERNLKIPKPPKDVYYRNLGTMEHNICDVLGKRMKNNKTTWSIKGAENMARILSIEFSK